MPRVPQSPTLCHAADPVTDKEERRERKRKAKAAKAEQEAEGKQVDAVEVPVASDDLAPKRKKQRSEPVAEQEGTAPVPEQKTTERKVPSEGALSADEFRKQFHITAVIEGQKLPKPVQTFDDAPFADEVKLALKAAGFPAPSPIQAQGWPIAVKGKDLVAVAKTGSGKTLGFLLPAFKAIMEKMGGAAAGANGPSVLVLAPTRELANQIEVECTRFGKCLGITSAVVFGGAPKGPQIQALKSKPSVIVATPGRLQDLMEMGVASVKNVQFLVLDEADRMLDMGFEPEIAKILEQTPPERQTLLFTATWPKAVKKIAAKYLKEDFKHVNVGESDELAANKSVSQEFFALGDDEKEMKVWRILDAAPDNAKFICFANTKRRIVQLKKAFSGYSPAELHGDMQQWDRDVNLADFASGKKWVLFATDVCARGLDVKDITHVINYDMARDVESYVHRIGRTGRAGATGTSITFWNKDYDMECAPALAKIAREAGQEVPPFLEAAAGKQTQVKNKAWRY